MPQEQKLVPLRLASGEEAEAVATGNNAAWLCPCGYRLPLLGYSTTNLSLVFAAPNVQGSTELSQSGKQEPEPSRWRRFHLESAIISLP